MSWSQAFGIINQVIAAVNALNEAVDGALVNGRIDYNSIVNRPQINGVELIGNITQAELDLSLDGETLGALSSMNDRVESVVSSLAQKVSAADLVSTLQDYAKTTDIPDVSGFVTTTTMNNALAQKVDTTVYNNTLTQLNTAIGSKASAGEVPTTVQWNNLLAQMEAKVTQAGNSATAAANSATTCTTQCGIATQKAQEASQSAQSLSGALTRISDLEDTVNGTHQTSGLSARTLSLETKVGNAGEKTSVTDDLKETRTKSNDILAALKEAFANNPEMLEQVENIAALDVNY